MGSTSAGQDGGFKVKRIQANVVAIRERQLLTWLCAKLPGWIMPDHLTLISVLGAFIVLAGYACSRWVPGFLWLASLGLIINWFGDSLDGSLARFRRTERPIYGYFLDHTVDALNNLMIMGGIGLTSYVRMDIALFTLLGYYLLCMYVFITNHLSGIFQLSFLGFGPTELRLCLIAINTGMLVAGRVGVTIEGSFFSTYDGILLFAGVIFTCIFIVRVLIGIRTFRDPARSGAIVQSAATNASSDVK